MMGPEFEKKVDAVVARYPTAGRRSCRSSGPCSARRGG